MWSYWAAGGHVRAEPFHNPLRFHADVHPPRPGGPHLIRGAGRTDRCMAVCVYVWTRRRGPIQ